PPPIICFDQEIGHMEEDIMNWLDSVIYNDECNEVKVINNFELDNINNHCIPEYDMNVLFVASDICGNTTECEGKITIISEISPSISCPVPLSLECGSQNNSQVINTWLSTAEGFDFEGNIIDATNSYLNNTPDITGCDIEMEVEFNVTDQCQFSASCKSRIRIKDTQAPLITCPPSLELNSTDSTNSEKIYSWMEKIEYEDSCSEVSVISFPDPTDLDLCNESLIDTIKFTANDQCENSSHCFSEIRINRAGPQLVCPDNLLVDCNSLEDISEEIEFWLNLAHATDNSSSENEVNHDFILADIQKSCDTEFTITFQTTDFCNASTECEAQIKITDTIEPVLDCPPSIQIDIAISSIETIVNNWLLSANASDNCTSIQLTNDFDTGIEEFKCNDQFDVLFKAEDECGNASYCYSELVIISDHELFIECPEPIELQCGEENNESLIYDFMMDYIIESELEYAVYTDIDYVELDLECSEAYIQYVTFHVNDKCDSYDSCESYISFLPAVKVFIPNVFTPNGDGNNERITVFGNEIVEQVQFLTIYDRWGNKIFYQEYFEPNDLSMGWDGRINGSYVQSAVYTYHTVVLDSMGEESQFTGTITLIK
ncbi:MAG: gliding motility-associated C-terminal domain-containing protein, partial [Bacteroidia bacterium]|nr:gliding motility-associated C-terminal domain-containing protein [Bacteroidia bacterium]